MHLKNKSGLSTRGVECAKGRSAPLCKQTRLLPTGILAADSIPQHQESIESDLTCQGEMIQFSQRRLC